MSEKADAIKTLGLEVNSESAARNVQALQEPLAKLETTGKRAAESVKALGSEANKQAASVDVLGKSSKFVWQTEAELIEVMNRKRTATKAVADDTETLADAQRRWLAESRSASKQVRETTIDLQAADKAYDELVASMKDVGEAAKQVTDSTREIGVAHAKAIEINKHVVDGQGNIIKQTDEAEKAFKRLRPGVAALTSQLAGFSSAGTNLLGVLGQMGVGAPVTVGVLAGVAAIGLVTDKLTEKWRAQAKAQRESTQALREWTDTEKQGAAGRRGLDLENAQKELDALERRRDVLRSNAQNAGGGAAGGAAGGLDRAATAKNLADIEQQIAKQEQLIRESEQRIGNIRRDAALDAYATLAKSNQLQAGERDKALLALRAYEQELASLNAKAARGFSIPEEELTRRRELVNQIETLKDALNPKVESTKGFDAAVDRLANVRSEVERLKEAAASFGKETTIDQRIARITDSLDAMEKKFPSLTKQIAEYRTEAVRAGEAMKAGALASVTSEIEKQHQAQRELFDAVRKGGTAYGELSAARAADLEIAQREATLGTTLSETLKQRIRDTKELESRISAARGTNDIQSQADAMRAETEAIKSGASTRATYTADLLYERQLKDALQITNADDRAARIAAVEALHNESVARIELTESMKRNDDEMKKAERTVDRASNEAERLSRVLRGDLLSAIQDLTNGGITSFDDFFDKLGAMSVKAITAIDRARDRMRQNLEQAKAEKANGIDLTKIEDDIRRMERLQRTVGLVQIGAGSYSGGYAVGSQTTSKTAGALGGAVSGAAQGAAIASIVPGIGTAVGAVVGAVVGAIGGLVGSSDKGKQAAAQMIQNQSKIDAALEGLRASFANDALGASIAQAKSQFDDLRKGTEAAYAGKKNEAERNRVLAELNKLEAERLRIILDEYNVGQKRAQEDLRIREMIAKGLDAQGAAAAFAAQQERELEDARKAGANAATLAQIATTQAAEAEKFAADQRKKEAAEAERQRRTLADLTIGRLAFSDPRGASDAAFAESQRRRLADAADGFEKVAAAAYNAAEKLDRIAQIQLKDFTDSANALARILNASGNTRGGEDASRLAAQLNELDQAFRGGASANNLLLLQRAQYSENSALLRDRNIADATKRLTDEANEKLKGIDDIIKRTQEQEQTRERNLTRQVQSERDLNAIYTEVKRGEIESIRARTAEQSRLLDQQLSAAQAAQQATQQQVQLLRQEVEARRRAVESLNTFADSLSLGENSTLSPVDKRKEAERQLQVLFGAARNGDANAADGFGSAASAFLQASRPVNASGAGFVADSALVQSMLATLRLQFGDALGKSSNNLTSAERAADAQARLIEGLQQQKEALQLSSSAEIDAINKSIDAANTRSADLIASWEKEGQTAAENAAKIIEEQQKLREQVVADLQTNIDAVTVREQAAHEARLQAVNWLERLHREQQTARQVLEALAGTLSGGIQGDGGSNRAPTTLIPATQPTAGETAIVSTLQQQNTLLQQQNTQLVANNAKLEAMLQALSGAAGDARTDARGIVTAVNESADTIRRSVQRATVNT